MDFDHLVTFCEIAKQGSFSRAGQKLYRSQPAVSAQIRQLEQEYGQKLFDRVGNQPRVVDRTYDPPINGHAGPAHPLHHSSHRGLPPAAGYGVRPGTPQLFAVSAYFA